jgi:hypothetical protein
MRRPCPAGADIVLADFAIEATLAQAAPDYDLIIQANVLLSRTIATSADDALTSQAIQPSDDGKRTAQSLQTIQYQQAAWEKAQVLALTRRVLSSDEGDREALVRERQRILYAGNEFTRQLQRLRAALTEKSGTGAVDTVASLATVRQLLLAMRRSSGASARSASAPTACSPRRRRWTAPPAPTPAFSWRR